MLTAQAAQAERLLNERFRPWQRDRKARLLLSLAELQRVLKYQDQFRWGGNRDEKVAFIRRSKNRRNVRYVLAGFVVVLSVVGFSILAKAYIYVPLSKIL